MLDKERLQILSTLFVTAGLLLFAYLLVNKAFDIAIESERVSPETLVAGIMALANAIVIAAVARWLQQGAEHTAEKQAEKLQQAVANVTATNGTQADTVNVEGEEVTVTSRDA